MEICLGNSQLPNKPDLARQVDEEKEAQKQERARLVLAGHPFSADDDDPFEGLTPQVLLTPMCHAHDAPPLSERWGCLGLMRRRPLKHMPYLCMPLYMDASILSLRDR